MCENRQIMFSVKNRNVRDGHLKQPFTIKHLNNSEKK